MNMVVISLTTDSKKNYNRPDYLTIDQPCLYSKLNWIIINPLKI